MSEEAYQHFRVHGGLIDLSDRIKLRVSGADRVRYLNGQLTANVTKLKDEGAIPACVTTAKGKLSGEVFLCSPNGEFILVDADASLRDSLLARLERYIVADDVTVEDVTDAYALWHYFVPPAVDTRLPTVTVGGELTSSWGCANRYGTRGWDQWLKKYPDFSPTPDCPHLIPPELGETIRIEGGELDFKQKVDSIQIEHEAVKSAKAGDDFGMKVKKKVHDGYRVYKA